MPRLAANLSYLFTERPFLDRFEAAAACGFRAIEHQFPYGEASESAIRERLRDHDLRVVLFNLPAGKEGERGLGGLPGREAEFREAFELALRYCRATGCPRLHAMWGVPDAETSLEESRATFVANLRAAAPRAAEAGVTLLVEPLNPRDNPRLSAQTGRPTPMCSSPRSALRTSRCSSTSITARSSKATWRRSSSTGWAARRATSGTSRSRARRTESSPMQGSSTTRGCFRSSTRWATRAGSAAEYRPAAGTEGGSRLGEAVGDSAAARGRGRRSGSIGASSR